MSDAWEALATDLAERLSEELSVALARQRLSNRLLEFRFEPPREGAAEIGLVASPDGVILSAGAGTLFELERLPDSEQRITVLVHAIGAGGLSETLWPHRVKFELLLESGDVLRGGTRQGLLPRTGKARHVQYAAYRVNPAP